MKRTLLAVILLGILLSPVAYGRQPPIDLVLLNGKIFTAEGAKSFAEALAVAGDRIVAVGSSREIEGLAGGATRRIDLKGRLVVPGFNDAHFHFTPSPEGVWLHFRTNEPSWEETRRAIEEAVRKAPPGTWIFGEVGHDVLLVPEVNRFVLDRIAPDHPVLLRTYYGHGYVINSRAMPVLQIAEEEPDPMGGSYERLPGSKRINGRFNEYAEWKTDRKLASQVSDAEIVKRLKALAHRAAGFGITSMQIMPKMPIDRFARLVARAALPIRVRAITFSKTGPRSRDLSEIRGLSKLKFPEAKVSVKGIKWILDGTPLERGAALRGSYRDRPGWKGRLNFSPAQIGAMIQESLDFRQQLLLHCSGDRSVEVVFNAMDRYKGLVDWKTKRLRIEHGDGLMDDLIPRARRLGVIVIQNPTHFTEPELFHRRWGGGWERLRSLIEAGIPVAIGSDGPMNPFLNIMLAATHPYEPKEAITRRQAVRAYTYESAFAEFTENEKGTITEGKLADLAVLSRDIFTAPLPELPKTRSVLTMVGGEIVYDAGVLDKPPSAAQKDGETTGTAPAAVGRSTRGSRPGRAQWRNRS